MRTHSSDPSFRLDVRRRWALAASIFIGSLIGAAVSAVPPGMSFHSIDPLDGSLLVARTAANNPLAPPTFQLKADIRFDNGGTFDETVTQIEVSYPGSSIATRTYTPVFFDGDGNQQFYVMPAGDRNGVLVVDGLERDLPLPLPDAVDLRVWFGFDPVPIDLSFSLALHENAVPHGAYFFPARSGDMAPGRYWRFGTRHTVDSGGGNGTINPTAFSQKYALDLDMVRWDGAAWTNLGGGDGSRNVDHLAWSRALYAMHDGTIVSCYRGEMDHAPADSFDDISFLNTFGNSISIRYGDEVVTIAHLQQGWPSLEHCPERFQNDGLSIPVEAGEMIGRVGNTGRSTAPHIHMQAARVAGTGAGGRVGAVPIRFLNLRTLAADASIQNLADPPALQPHHGLALHRHSLIVANPCGFGFPSSGGTEVARHGIPAECYQDVFHEITTRGYRPVWVDGYRADGESRFNAIFRPQGPASVARHGLTGAAYQDLFDDLTADGFRLHQIDSYLGDGGAVRYAAIFEKRSGPPWAALHGLGESDFQIELDTLTEAGFVPVNLSIVEADRSPQWTALFEQVPVHGWTAEAVPVATYQATFDANVRAGRALATIDAFETAAGPYLSAIFVDPLPAPWVGAHGMDGSNYQSQWSTNLAAGRWTRAVTGWDTAGEDAFAALWRGAPNTLRFTGPPPQTADAEAAFEFGSDDPFARFACRLDGGEIEACSSPFLLDSLGEGVHRLEVWAIDREGLMDEDPAVYLWEVDFDLDASEIFVDGFEDGGLSAWSGHVG